MLALTGIDIHRCPLCQNGTLMWVSQLAVPIPWNSSWGSLNQIKTRAWLWLGTKANAELYSVSPFCLLLVRLTVCTAPCSPLETASHTAHHHATHSSAASVYLDVPLTIPIGDGTYLSQRFSPLAFNLSAPELTAITDNSVLAFRLKPKQSLQSYQALGTLMICSLRRHPPQRETK
jgi:hypothetical protein